MFIQGYTLEKYILIGVLSYLKIKAINGIDRNLAYPLQLNTG